MTLFVLGADLTWCWRAAWVTIPWPGGLKMRPFLVLVGCLGDYSRGWGGAGNVTLLGSGGLARLPYVVLLGCSVTISRAWGGQIS